MSFTHQGREIRKVAVIGSGQIGPDIALYFTKVLSPFGVQTVVVDVSEDALAGGRKKLEKKVAKGVETGAFREEQQAKMVSSVSWTTDYEDIRGAPPFHLANPAQKRRLAPGGTSVPFKSLSPRSVHAIR